MDVFSKELLRVGTLKGFKHFSCYLRGREELLVEIRKTPLPAGTQASGGAPGAFLGADGAPAPTAESYAKSQMVPMSPAPRSFVPESPMRAIQPDLHGKPPASPADQSGGGGAQDGERCVFLIGAYQRYQSPFVWLRTGTLEGYTETDRDVPLKLETTTRWQEGSNSKVVEVIAELVKTTVRPRVANPFEVDFERVEGMGVVQSTFATGALMHMLREMVASGLHSTCEAYMLSDMERLAQVHFVCFSTLADAAVAEESREG